MVTEVRALLLALALAAGCTSNDDVSAGRTPARTITPGVSVGDLMLGDSYATLRARLGPAESEVGLNHLVFGRWPRAKLEVVFASDAESSLGDEAKVLAIGVRTGAELDGPLQPGATRAALIERLGAPSDEVGAILYWPSGISAQLGDDGSALQLAVYRSFAPQTTAAEMTPSKGSTGTPLNVDPSIPARGGVVDMHLHPGMFGRIPRATREFIMSSIPAFTQLYAPGALSAALDPFAPFVGIRAQTDSASIEHAVLFAVYTQKTTGWFANEDLEQLLTDARNVAPDGLPWAFGLASIDFFDGFLRDDGTVDPVLEKARLDALSSYFAKRRDLFIGIKLAHPHQQVAFDDARYLGVYGVAAKHQVPVYLHTGFSPFPNAKNERAFYDPEGLRNTVVNHPNVKFILGHVGQGDALSIEHCLAMAKEFPNVFLEISALGRPILRDLDGHDVPADKDKPQYLFVLDQLKRRGLVDKTIFGSDGPQYVGMVRSYVTTITTAMRERGYTDEDIAKVMSRNFYSVFFGAG